MKIKRLKNYSRLLENYQRHFGLELDPLEIFVDYTFARQALSNKLNLQDQFKSTLHVPVKLVTSSCVIKECEVLGSVFHGVLSILNQFKILPCRHTYNPKKSATWCIKRRILSTKTVKLARSGRKTLFGLATNDEDLQHTAHSIPGMPVFYVAHCRFNLEPPPLLVAQFMEENTFKATEISTDQSLVIDSLNKRFGLLNSAVNKPKKKRAKEPNPLSCKKKSQRNLCPSPQKRPRTKKRRRKRIKNTWAFQQVLAKVKAEMGIL